MAQPATPMQPRRESTPSIPPKLVPAADLVKRLQELHESIARRAYESFESKGRTCGRDLEDWLQAESEFLHPVHVDVAESDDGLTVRAEVPGFRGENLMVGVEVRRLAIAGKRESLRSSICIPNPLLPSHSTPDWSINMDLILYCVFSFLGIHTLNSLSAVIT